MPPTAVVPTAARRSGLLSVAALVAVTAVWGTTFVVVAGVIEKLPVFAFLSWRFGIAVVVLLLLRPRAVLLLDRRDLRRGAAIGAALGLGYWLQTFGLYTTPATVSGFITGMFLVFTPLVAWLMTREQVARSAWFAVALATVGLALISLKGFSVGIGELITLGGALMFAFQIVWLSLWSTPQKAYGLAVVQLGVVALMSMLVVPFESGPKVPPDAGTWAAVIFLAVVATALAFVVQTWGQAHIEPTRAAVILTLEPVFAGVTGLLVGEQLTARVLAGCGLVLVAMYVVELGPRRARDASLPHLEP